jgi:hypothetical protein
MTRSILLCGLLALSATAWADTPVSTPSASAATHPTATAAAQAPVAAATAAPAKPKLVCENIHELGYHTMSRVCMTPEQMAARKKAAREQLERMQQSGQSCMASGSGC